MLLLKTIKIPTETYLMDYSKAQLKWRKIKSTSNSYKHRYELNRNVFSNIKNNDILILEYTKVGNQPRFCGYFDNTNYNETAVKNMLFMEQCPYKNCRFTCDKQRQNEANVLLFHESDLNRDLENDRDYLSNLKRKVNRRSQIWLLWNDEVSKNSIN